MRYVKIILMTVFITSSLCSLCACDEAAKKDSAAIAIDESLYNKETIPVDNIYACQVGYTSACEVPVLLNKATKKVEYYWSGADNKWVNAGDRQAAFQALYDKREEVRTQRQLKSMQDEMDRRHRESMEEGRQDIPAHR